MPSYQAGLSAQWTRTAGAHQTLAAGFDGQEVRGASNELMYSSGSISDAVGAGGRQRFWGLYGEDIVRINTRWLITGGARVDDWSNYDALSVKRPLATPGPLQVTDFLARSEQAFSPRLSTLFRVKENLAIRASMYRAFRPPTLNELYRNFRQGNTLTEANSGLTAEQLTGAEAGASYSAWHERLSVRGTLFWSDISNPIANVTLSTTPSLITQQRQNLGETRSRGIELEAEGSLTRSVTLSGGYQFVDATVTSFPGDALLVGLLVPHVPRHDLTFQARYSRPAPHYRRSARKLYRIDFRRCSEHAPTEPLLPAQRTGFSPAGARHGSLCGGRKPLESAVRCGPHPLPHQRTSHPVSSRFPDIDSVAAAPGVTRFNGNLHWLGVRCRRVAGGDLRGSPPGRPMVSEVHAGGACIAFHVCAPPKLQMGCGIMSMDEAHALKSKVCATRGSCLLLATGHLSLFLGEVFHSCAID